MSKMLKLTERQANWLYNQIHYGLGDAFDPSYARSKETKRQFAMDRRIRDNIEKKLEKLI